MSKTFINLSNLHTNKWPEDRLKAAEELADGGEIINIAFPMISPSATKEEVNDIAKNCVEKVAKRNPDIVFCQGEFSLCFRIVELLKELNIKVVTVCNERVVTDTQMPVFKFIQFREF